MAAPVLDWKLTDLERLARRAEQKAEEAQRGVYDLQHSVRSLQQDSHPPIDPLQNVLACLDDPRVRQMIREILAETF